MYHIVVVCPCVVAQYMRSEVALLEIQLTPTARRAEYRNHSFHTSRSSVKTLSCYDSDVWVEKRASLAQKRRKPARHASVRHKQPQTKRMLNGKKQARIHSVLSLINLHQHCSYDAANELSSVCHRSTPRRVQLTRAKQRLAYAVVTSSFFTAVLSRWHVHLHNHNV